MVNLNGHEARNGGYSQGRTCTLPRQRSTPLHYVLDLWTQAWRGKWTRGDVIIVRYGDDFIVGFQNRNEAEQYLERLRHRFEHFGLELHADKTRLIEFGRFTASTRAKRGASKPETFNFLGITHFYGKTRKGWFTVGRSTMRQRWQAKLQEVKAELRSRMHVPAPGWSWTNSRRCPGITR